MEYINCNLCNSQEEKVLYKVKERLLGKEEFKIVQCKGCGLVYTNPRPTLDEIKKYYPTNYYSDKFSYPSSLFPARTNRIRVILKKKILMIHYGYFTNSPTNPFVKNLLRIITLPLKYRLGLSLPPYKEGGKVLDIGCATGHYLFILRELGWDTYGVEPDPMSSAWAREKLGLNVITGRLEETDFSPDYFDVVTLWHTLEHFHDPLSALKKVHEILKKDGLIICVIPDMATFNRKVFGSRWWGWEVPRHLYHFSSSTIVKLLNKVGFKVCQIETLPYLAITLLSLQNLLIDYFPKKAEWIRNFFSPANSKLCFWLMPLGYLGAAIKQVGEITVYAQK